MKIVRSFLFPLLIIFSTQLQAKEELPTFFCYTQAEVNQLEGLTSEKIISKDSLIKWDEIVNTYTTADERSSLDMVRFYTYLYNAQKEFAFFSYNQSKDFVGSLDPICDAICSLFIKKYRRPEDFSTDSYSQTMSSIVFDRFKRRYDTENERDEKFSGAEKYGKKTKLKKMKGVYLARWTPWFIKSANLFLPKEPPKDKDPEWTRQLDEIRNAQKNMTEQEKESIYYWAGMPDVEASDLRKNVNYYLFNSDVDLRKTLTVRSALLTGFYDANIATFYAKYYYNMPRPSLRDPTIKPEIDVPPHPSYPSAHSVLCFTAATILTHYFPEKAEKWEQMAEDGGMSRIRAGIHYPMDHKAGKEMGKKIGKVIIENEDFTCKHEFSNPK